MSELELSDIDITGVDEHPVDDSVKLWGPPGTGKTTESAARVAELIDDYGYEVDDVFWATYRRSLAVETLERLAGWGLLSETELADPSEGRTRFIGTTHAVANRLVGGVGDIAGYGEKRAFAGKRNLDFDASQPWEKPPGQLLFNVFSYAANNKLDLHKRSDLEQIPMYDDLKSEYHGSVARAWDDWQDWKAQRDLYDFWELLAAPLRQDTSIQQDVVVIDEYHDATPLMAELAEDWISQAEIAIVAGDPLQVVNSYAGARPEFFERLDLPEVLLDTTHRVPEQSWSVATEILGNAHEVPHVQRQGTGGFLEGNSPRFSYESGEGWNVPSPDDQRSPAHIVSEYGKDTMFLTRTQRQAHGISRALEKAGVLFETQQSMDIDGWGAQEGMNDRTALYNALQRLTDVSLGAKTGHGLGRYTDDKDDRQPSDMVFRAPEAATLLDHTNHSYLDVKRDEATQVAVEWENAEVPVDGDELANHVTDEWWEVYTRGSGSVRHLNKTAHLNTADTLKSADMDALKKALEANDDPVTTLDTKVYTIHASKGSEADNVVVYDGITQTIREEMIHDDDTRKNEYRTWYVALTRASKNTFVLRDAYEWTYKFLPDSLMQIADAATLEGEA